jgi:hypothetical protein
MVVHRVGNSIRQPRQGSQLVERGRLHSSHASELVGQPLASRWPETGDPVEGALRHALLSEVPVERDGEAVSLVPGLL